MRFGAATVVAVLLVGCSGPNGTTTALPAMPEIELPVTDLEAIVTSVADGDSFRARAASGEIVEVRLVGINSPEKDECHGEQAAAGLNDLIQDREVGLATEPELDQFDRVLARAVVDGTYVNLEMVLRGHSLVSGTSPDRVTLIDAESVARVREAGMWAADVCGATGPRASLEISNIDYDPPGSDEFESVTILNTGAEPIGLEGFMLRDESSVNRFGFPAMTVAPGNEVTITRGCGTSEGATLGWCTDQPVWNNGGDAAFLLDGAGRIVAFFRY